MTGLRERLPQGSGDELFVTDGGLETELVFHDGIDLPCFAAFPLLDNPEHRARLRRYYDGYLDIARKLDAGFIVETPTWRANPDWASTLGYSLEQLDAVNRSAVALAEEVRTAAAADGITVVVSGCVGPRGDGYDPGDAMTAEEAQRYHAVQIGTFASTTADQVTAITMTNAEEAIGIVRAASAAGIPAAISFTVETDGRLPTGQPLHEAIEQVDAATDAGAAYFMVNCAHPTHFAEHWNTTGHGGNGWSACARTLPRRAMPSSTRRPSWTREIRMISPPGTPRCATNCPPSGCSAAAAARTPATWRRSARPGVPIRLLRHPKKYRYLTAQVPLFVRCGGSPGVHTLRYMSENPNVTTVNKMTQAIINEDKETLTSLFADGFVFHMRAPFAAAGDHYGVDGLLGAIGAVFEATNGDVQLEQQFCIGTDGWVAEWEHAVLGRHGRTLESDNAFVYRFAGNRIAEMWMFVGADPDAAASFFA